MPPDVQGHEPGRTQGFVASLLRHQGALVESIEPDGLEVLAPAQVQAALGVAELSRLSFGTTLPPSAQRVGIESDWLGRFGEHCQLNPDRATGDPMMTLLRGSSPGLGTCLTLPNIEDLGAGVAVC